MKTEPKFKTKIVVFAGVLFLIAIALITFNMIPTKETTKTIIDLKPTEANATLNEEQDVENNKEEEIRVENNVEEKIEVKSNKNKEINIELGSWVWPATSKSITRHYGEGTAWNGIEDISVWHSGIDISAGEGDPIYAANNGVIVAKENSGCYGNYIMIDHGNGLYTLYAQMTGFADVSVGETVTGGQTIGYAGSTGCATGSHLHFEIRTCEEYSCTTNPTDYYNE